MKRVISIAALAVATGLHAQTPVAPPAAEPLDTMYQTYEEGPISLPLGIGLRIPAYDRVNGLSVPWGPHIAVPGGRVELDPIVTYRSNLGKVDPSITAVARFGHFDQLDVSVGRGTFTNDSWIRSDIINSLTAIGVGTDARNYFRADRVRADFSHRIEKDPWKTRLWIGGNYESDWSTGFHSRHSTSPWSFFGRTDSLKMRRINPEVFKGHIASGLAGIDGEYENDDLKGKIAIAFEHAFDGASLCDVVGNGNHPAASLAAGSRGAMLASDDACEDELGDGKFDQLTIDVRATFPTFGLQSFEFKGHGVATGGDPSPQRYVYLGGAGTLSTVDLLALGGDRLFFVRGDYNYPLVRPLLPYVGAPVLSAMYAAGSAGTAELPDFIQNIGVAVGLKVIKVEYWVDPSYNKTAFSHKSKFSIGFSLAL